MEEKEEKRLRDRIEDLEFDVENANRHCRFISTVAMVGIIVLAIELSIHKNAVHVKEL